MAAPVAYLGSKAPVRPAASAAAEAEAHWVRLEGREDSALVVVAMAITGLSTSAAPEALVAEEGAPEMVLLVPADMAAAQVLIRPTFL